MAVGLAVGAMLVPLLAPPAAGAATVPPVPSPSTVLTVFPWEGSMEDELQGRLCQAPNNCVRIDQFLWDPRGVATIETTIDTTPGTKVVFSYSEGARSVSDWLQAHAGDVDAPSPEKLSFVVIGNPTRAYGGSDREAMPQTQYQVIDISRQYDPASDFPDNPGNLLALLNSLAAFTVIHTDYEGVDMYDPANVVWKEGNTTYVFVPTEKLPLLEPLRRLGLTGLADTLNAPLKAIVERAYDRSYLSADGERSSAASVRSAPPASSLTTPRVESELSVDDDAHVDAANSGESTDTVDARDVAPHRKSTINSPAVVNDSTDAEKTAAAEDAKNVAAERDSASVTGTRKPKRSTTEAAEDTRGASATDEGRDASASQDSSHGSESAA